MQNPLAHPFSPTPAPGAMHHQAEGWVLDSASAELLRREDDVRHAAEVLEVLIVVAREEGAHSFEANHNGHADGAALVGRGIEPIPSRENNSPGAGPSATSHAPHQLPVEGTEGGLEQPPGPRGLAPASLHTSQPKQVCSWSAH